MDSSRRLIALTCLALASAAACVSTPVQAPNDGQILLSASPPSIALDEFATPVVDVGSTVVTAHVFDMSGLPQPNVQVFFSTDGGVMTSAGLADPALETDASGRVSDTLTVQLGDPDSINVTVRSGTLDGSITILKNETAANQPPFAVIDITPANSAVFNETVIFDGSFSADPDNDPITCYQWEIKPSVNISAPELECVPPSSRCEVIQGPGSTFVTRNYNSGQSIAVTLRVTDDSAVPCPTNGPATPASSFNGMTVAAYEIVCDRTAPFASAGPNQVRSLGGNASVGVVLSGAGSSEPDPGQSIVDYQWICANSNGDTPNGVSVVCDYDAAGVYPVTLTVTNTCGLTAVDGVTIEITN